MSGAISAPAFPSPIQIQLPSKYQNLKQPTHLPTKVANFAADEAGDTGTIGNFSKILRAVLKIFIALGEVSKEIGDTVVSHLSAIIDSFKVLGIFKNIKTIVENAKGKEGETKSERAQRFLKIAGSTTGIAIATMTGVKLLDSFKLLKIASISKAMGVTSVASAPLRAALSFPVVFSVFEIVENAFAIANSSISIHRLNKTMDSAKLKAKQWKPVKPGSTCGEPIDMIAAGKLKNIPVKREALKVQAETVLAPKMVEAGEKYTNAQTDYDKIKDKKPKTYCAKISRNASLKKAEIKLKRAARDYTQACKKFETAKGAFDKLGVKLERWQVIEDKFKSGFTKKDEDALSAFKAEKENKWKTKIKNITWNKVKEGLSLGMSIFLTIFLITSIALAIAFPVSLPLSAIIGLSVGGLLISVGFTVKHFLPKLMDAKKWGKEPYKSVDVPELEKAPVVLPPVLQTT